jgi:hypothetical protein
VPANTNSIALFYLSAWKNTASARAFARLYADELGRKYSRVKLDHEAQSASPVSGPSGFTVYPPLASLAEEQVYSTNEGPVIITTRGKLVFVAESFDLDVARKLTTLILDAQGTGELKMAEAHQPAIESLTTGWIRFFSNYGVMKTAVEAEIKGAATAKPE